MRVRGWLLTLVAFVTVGVVLSGSSVLRRTPERMPHDNAHAELVDALRAVDARLQYIETLPHAATDTALPAQTTRSTAHASAMTSDVRAATTATGGEHATAGRTAHAPGEPMASVTEMRDRVAVIEECIDSLQSSNESWRAALPGLRSAVADLEYRTDLAWIDALDSNAELDARIELWLQEMNQQFQGMVYTADGEVHVDTELGEVRLSHARLTQRFATLRQPGSDTGSGLRRSLAAELAQLRRTVRALVRTSRHVTADTVR